MIKWNESCPVDNCFDCPRYMDDCDGDEELIEELQNESEIREESERLESEWISSQKGYPFSV